MTEILIALTRAQLTERLALPDGVRVAQIGLRGRDEPEPTPHEAECVLRVASDDGEFPVWVSDALASVRKV